MIILERRLSGGTLRALICLTDAASLAERCRETLADASLRLARLAGEREASVSVRPAERGCCLVVELAHAGPAAPYLVEQALRAAEAALERREYDLEAAAADARALGREGHA